MTEIDRNPSGHLTRAATRDLLGDTSNCPPGSIIVNYVGVAQVLLPNGSKVVVRGYPCGPVDGSTERGILGDALRDSEHQRDGRRRPC